MDYSLITEQAINNRYNTVPEELRDAVDSEQTQKLISNISKTQYLNEEKSLILEQLVALVLLGFMSTNELVHELREQLFLNHEHARVLANELNNRIFESLKEELAAAYNPPAATIEQEAPQPPSAVRAPAEEPLPITSFKIAPEAAPAPASTPAPISPVSINASEGGPAVLQKQTPFFERAELKPTGKKPSLSFNTFASSSETTEPPRVQAKIETPLGVQWAAKKEEPKKMGKVVHYSEFGSSGGGGRPAPVSEFINLEALKKVSLDTKPAPAAPQVAPAAPQSASPAPQQPPAAPSAPILNPDVPTLITPVATIKPAPIEEKKSPLMWGINPISVSVPTATTADSGPKRMDAIVPNAGSPAAQKPAPVPISSDTKQPALEGNVIHLR